MLNMIFRLTLLVSGFATVSGCSMFSNSYMGFQEVSCSNFSRSQKYDEMMRAANVLASQLDRSPRVINYEGDLLRIRLTASEQRFSAYVQSSSVDRYYVAFFKDGREETPEVTRARRIAEQVVRAGPCQLGDFDVQHSSMAK